MSRVLPAVRAEGRAQGPPPVVRVTSAALRVKSPPLPRARLLGLLRRAPQQPLASAQQRPRAWQHAGHRAARLRLGTAVPAWGSTPPWRGGAAGDSSEQTSLRPQLPASFSPRPPEAATTNATRTNAPSSLRTDLLRMGMLSESNLQTAHQVRTGRRNDQGARGSGERGASAQVIHKEMRSGEVQRRTRGGEGIPGAPGERRAERCGGEQGARGLRTGSRPVNVRTSSLSAAQQDPTGCRRWPGRGPGSAKRTVARARRTPRRRLCPGAVGFNKHHPGGNARQRRR